MGWTNYEGRGEQAAPTRILFWGDKPGERPHDFVREDIPRGDRQRLAQALRTGREVASYRGWANCRICGAHLGSRDMGGRGFVWPEKADHYLIEHDVWTPGCQALFDALGDV